MMPDAMKSRTTQRLAAAVVAIGLASWAWFGWFRHDVFPRNFGEVDAGRVYRSAALTPAATKRVHEKHGIRTIIDLGGYDKDPAGDRAAARTAAALGVDRFVFPLEGDGTGNPNAYLAALRIMRDPTRQPVLVHCSAGAQRTSGAVMLYREFVQGRPLEETYPEAREYRHDPSGNPRLLPFVKQYEQQIGDALRNGGTIEGFPEVKPDLSAP